MPRRAQGADGGKVAALVGEKPHSQAGLRPEPKLILAIARRLLCMVAQLRARLRG
jgi:hypothetical protein